MSYTDGDIRRKIVCKDIHRLRVESFPYVAENYTLTFHNLNRKVSIHAERVSQIIRPSGSCGRADSGA